MKKCKESCVSANDVSTADLVLKYPELPRPLGNQGVRRAPKYRDVLTAFDIETSVLRGIFDEDGNEMPQSIMYIWMLQIGLDVTIIGRTWDEFKKFVAEYKRRSKGCRLVMYVHNLSHEFQYLAGVFNFEPEDVFCLESRKVLKAVIADCIELRCSYIHSNMSLAEYTRKMKVPHQKLAGELDYKKVRYPWTPVEGRDLEYCINDVRGLVEAITTEMEHDGDNLYTIPLTSTGYVRRDAKAAMRKVNHNYVRGMLPNWHCYQMLREAFRGGNTHANRYYAGKVLRNVSSIDISSSYPAVQCTCKFPVGEFFEAGAITGEQLIDLLQRGKALVMRVAMWNVRLANESWGFPYLSKDKCRGVTRGVYDNGRILECAYLETTITDVDLEIIIGEYHIDEIVPVDIAYAKYGELPKELTDVTREYFRMKTELKNVDGEEIQYTKAKNKLNSIYGMSAQDPVKETVEFQDGEFITLEQDPELLLEKSRAFMPYQWGVWVTAWARWRLEQGLKRAGEYGVYCDTDSVKSLKPVDMTDFNDARKKECLETGSYARDPKGGIHWMGMYEDEGRYYRFSTLGAKKYIYQREKDGPITTTIAGVSKKEGGKELEEAGGFSAFKPGFVFRKAGGTETVYNDDPPVKEVNRDGHRLPITRNLVIKDSTYRLGITMEYAQLTGIKPGSKQER